MGRTLIGELKEHIGETVTISGWVDVRRDHGKLVFLDIRDRSGLVQAVVTPKAGTEAMEAAEKLRSQWVIRVVGEVKERPENMRNPDLANGDIEFGVNAIELLAEAQELPFDLGGEINIDTLFDYRPLTLRRERERAVFAIQTEVISAYRDFLASEGFTEFQAPKLVGDDAEGGGNVFKLEYFKDKDAYLATSPQLYKQIMVGVFERVFTTGNVFRAEKHATTRHLNEYTSIDMEMGFIADHTDVMAMEERLLRFIMERLEERAAEHLKTLGAEIPTVSDQIPRMKLREAQELITKETGNDCTNEPDLEPEHERWLCSYAREQLGSDFIFVTHYPVSKRPFYTYEDEEDPGFTKSFDLLFRGVEITTGGQREHRYDELIKKLEAKGLDPEDFGFYLQAFKYGMPPHGGWGMGLERLTQKLTGLDNVKEATLFPRDMNRIDTRLSAESDDLPAQAGEEHDD